MSKVTEVGKSTTAVMEARLEGGYVERTYACSLWRCDGCGLVWEKRWHAETCEEHGHKATWMQGPYGVTHVLNGVPQGNIKYYPRRAVRRDALAVR